MANTHNGFPLVLQSNAGGPPSGCIVCHTSDQSSSNGTVCYIEVKGPGFQICGECAQNIKATAP